MGNLNLSEKEKEAYDNIYTNYKTQEKNNFS